jgi:hypothetical protein
MRISERTLVRNLLFVLNQAVEKRFQRVALWGGTFERTPARNRLFVLNQTVEKRLRDLEACERTITKCISNQNEQVSVVQGPQGYVAIGAGNVNCEG